jgi:hypothetical protein
MSIANFTEAITGRGEVVFDYATTDFRNDV